MNQIIIFINFLLITLILYSVFNSKILENFKGCPKNESNAVYRQQASTDRLYGMINKLETKYNVLNSRININGLGIVANRKTTGEAVGEAKSEMDEEKEDLKKIGKNWNSNKGPSIKGKFKGGDTLSNSMKHSSSEA